MLDLANANESRLKIEIDISHLVYLFRQSIHQLIPKCIFGTFVLTDAIATIVILIIKHAC